MLYFIFYILFLFSEADDKIFSNMNHIVLKNPNSQFTEEVILPSPKYTLRARNLSLQNLCVILEKIFNKKFINIFGSNLKVNINFEDFSEQDMIENLIQKYSIGFAQVAENTYRVYPNMIVSRIFQLNYHDFQRSGNSNMSSSQGGSVGSGSTSIGSSYRDGFWSDLRGDLGLIIDRVNKEDFIVNETTKTVLVKAGPKTMYNVEKMIKKINKKYEYQVILEAEILQLSRTKTKDLALQWPKITDVINNLYKNYNNPVINTSNLDTGEAVNNTKDVTDNIDIMNTLIKAINEQGKASVLSSPRVALLNNQKTLLQFGQSKKVLQQITIDKEKDGEAGATSQLKYQLQDIFLGVTFSAAVNIINSNEIILHVQPMVSSENVRAASTQTVTVGSGKIEMPVKTIDTKQSDTVIRANNNDIILLGGLANTQKSEDYKATNFLEYIFPFLRSKSVKYYKEELIIIIKINIVKKPAILEYCNNDIIL